MQGILDLRFSLYNDFIYCHLDLLISGENQQILYIFRLLFLYLS